MLKEGDTIYFEEQGKIHEDRIKHLTEESFELENYGCCCEGQCVINRSMIGYTFFTDRKELEARLKLLN